MANNQDSFIFEENLPMRKFCFKEMLHSVKTGDGHWHSQVFWHMGQIITMTVTVIMNLKKSQIVPELHFISSPI
jgi:hypothetical protein